MRPLSASELLNVWEQGWGQNPAQQALALLAAASPEISLEQLAKLSIGQRNACLLQLRAWTFGPKLPSLATCPNCNERLELNFNVSDILVTAESDPAEAISISISEHEVRFRLPQSRDLIEIANQKDPQVKCSLLLERCLLEARYKGKKRNANQLPTSVVEAIVQRMAEVDPQANMEITLSCSACSHKGQAMFDIVSYFWSEINAWAHRTLREVHLLASTYGWREADILAMSSARRQLYLEMARS
jgi:hypothetical protein